MKSKTIGNYEVGRVIGKGSFGEVYLGKHQKTLEEVALKYIIKKGRTHQQIKNLKLETQLLTKISHNHVIAMRQCLETDQEIVVVMDYAATDLARLLQREKRLPEQKVRFFGRQILSALLYLHENRILHRDLKPQNILLHKDQLKLCDFGFAKKMSASTNFLKSIKGTPLYIAPQILQSKQYTHKVDIWSFGIILYELFTGRTPFYASTIQQLTPKIIHDYVRFPANMPIALRELIDGMLQKTEAKRYDWDQVKNHPFFAETEQESCKEKQGKEKSERQKIERQKMEKQKQKLQKIEQWEEQPKVEIKFDIEQECRQMVRIDEELTSGRLQPKELKFNQQFGIKITQLLGQACLERLRIPSDIIQRCVRILSLLIKSKQKGQQQEDVTRGKNLMGVIVTLAGEQKNEDLLWSEMELIGYMLKQNFDGIKIDNENDDQITTLVANIIRKENLSHRCLVIALKVLGILASQAIITISQSQDFFIRIAEEKLLSLVCAKYAPNFEYAIVLECLQKFVHPQFQRKCQISQTTYSLFSRLRQQVAIGLLKNEFIGQKSVVEIFGKNQKGTEVQLYTKILFECLSVSHQARQKFLLYKYWPQLLVRQNTKVFFLSFSYLLLLHEQAYILTNDMIQNDITKESNYNKLINVYLTFSALYNIKKRSQSAQKTNSYKTLLGQIKNLLALESNIKNKNCWDLFGFFSDGGRHFDDVLINILSEIVKENKGNNEILQLSKSIVQFCWIELKLSVRSVVTLLNMSQVLTGMNIKVAKKVDEYFSGYMARDTFEEYLATDVLFCRSLVTKLMEHLVQRTIDQKQVSFWVELFERQQMHRLIFNQQLLTEQLFLLNLVFVNRCCGRFRSGGMMDYLGINAVQSCKSYFRTTNEQLRVQLITFCSFVARQKGEYVTQLLNAGLVSHCPSFLSEGSELVKQKTLHLIGNLSKHSMDAFGALETNQIVPLISNCLNAHHKNKKILKNAIYAIGNIAYYGQRFANDIKPMLRYFCEVLQPSEENHMVLNTISTISNLLRHSNIHLRSLIESGITLRILEIMEKSSKEDQIKYSLSLLKKAMKYGQFFKAHAKQVVKPIVQKRMGEVKIDGETVKLLKNLMN